MPITGGDSMQIPDIEEAENVQLVGYHDLEDRPAFKMALQRRNDRWYLYLGHFWHHGWSIVDVTEPEQPELVRFVPGPANMRTAQVQVADGLMATGIEMWSQNRDAFDPALAGIYLWDVATDPTEPRRVGHYASGGDGAHRSFYGGGDLLYATVRNPEGFKGSILVIVDISDPAVPREIGRWWVPGQHVAAGETPAEGKVRLHGPAYVVGDRAYAGWGLAGGMILDVSDPVSPQLVSSFDFGDFSNTTGLHSVVPYPERNLLVANTEAVQEGHLAAPNPIAVIDVSEEMAPRIISTTPIPRPSPGLGYRNYYEKGGRFGPHNQHHHQGHPDLFEPRDHLVMTSFNAGLRIYSLEDPYMPVEVGYFVPAPPTRRLGPRPKEALVCSFEDVLIDARGNIFCTDANYGLFVLAHPGLN
jgi:hypothetical protein